MLISRLCTQEQLETEEYRMWCARLREEPRLHRKQWEFVYIARVLSERGMLSPGKRGLGFGVGREPLVALFAQCGCTIVATDQAASAAAASGWTTTAQYAQTPDMLNDRGICDRSAFARQVECRTVDMTRILDDITDFDFVWSSCALEHLGSLRKGEDFVSRSMKCLRAGGVAVHTTEYNVSSDLDTVQEGATVLFRRSDIEKLANRLRAEGCRVDVDFDTGRGPMDQHVDTPPYKASPHLKLSIGRYVSTSIALVIEKPSSVRA